MTKPEVIDTIKKRLVETYHPRTIYLFGSYAWGSADEQSDVDLLVVVDQADEMPYKRTRKGIASLRGLKISKDILVYTREEFENLAEDVSTLCHKVRQQGIKLYETA
ncbi:MAG: DNA polymerase III subunit beta [Syntrophus sp. (in: bacteria)]|nr:DNA polymerase III subunit beta [Syntrophus sp. (in: bacteria)]